MGCRYPDGSATWVVVTILATEVVDAGLTIVVPGAVAVTGVTEHLSETPKS